MDLNNDQPLIKKYFKDDNLMEQPVYKAKQNYTPLYINPKLYEELFGEKYDWDNSAAKLSAYFSITLNKEKANGEAFEKVFADKQFDPMGISLSGNLGSGRAYFYKRNFNIKGDKTLLATSKNPIYSNGKFALSASIKETIVSNILSKELATPTFETLAILDIHDDFEFVGQYLAEDDSIKEECFLLPSVIEIRVYKDKELYRVSNAFINNDRFSLEYLKEYCKKLADIEAYKFCYRFLHGSWSVGNITTGANLIDFDTSSFVKGRHPQYSNTNKYKSNYFGFELLGSKMIVKLLLDSINDIEDKDKIQNELEKIIDEKYKNNLLVYFCDLLGLDYAKHYEKYSEPINELFEKFNHMSREFIPNYYDLNISNENCDATCVFDFSNFFQRYLVEKKYSNKADIMLGLELLLNETLLVKYEKVGFIKEKVDEFFNKYMDTGNMDSTLNEAIDFINRFDSLFQLVIKNEDMRSIQFKAYSINANRKYLYGNMNTYWSLTKLYMNKVIDSETLNIIINALIKANIRKNDSKSNEYVINLEIYENYLSYTVISTDYYYYIVEPFSKLEARFMKIIIDGIEYMASYENNTWISEKVYFESIPNFVRINVETKINGESMPSKKLLENAKL